MATQISFDTWITNIYVWPDGVPTDCARLSKGEADCLEQNSPAPCPSCVEYAKACEAYENDVEGNHDAPKFRMFYECPIDGAKWTMEYSCTCNDRCPVCDKEIEAKSVEDL